MKAYNIHKCLTKRLDGCWDWYAHVWMSDRFFADFTISSPIDNRHGKFLTEDDAKINMAFVLDQLGLESLKKKCHEKNQSRRRRS